MNVRRILWLLLALAASAAIVAYFYRDSIARNAANAVLRDSGLRVVGLSIDSIGTSSIGFDELFLQTAGGTQIRVFGIVLPLNARSTRSGPLAIDEVELVASRGSDGPLPIAAILTAVLELPQTMPYPEVRISRISYEDIAPLQDVTWESRDQGQLLRFAIADFRVAAGVNSTDDSNHRVSLTATTDQDVIALALALSVTPGDGEFEIRGQSTTRVSPFIPVLRAYGMLPPEFTRIDALLRGTVHTLLPADPIEPFGIRGTLQPDGDIFVRHAIAQQPPAEVLIEESTSLVTTVDFPALTWRAGLQTGSLAISKGPLKNVPVSVVDLVCEQGVVCTVQANLRGADLALAGLTASSVSLSGPLRMLFEDRTQIDVEPGTTLELSGVQGASFQSSALRMTDFRGATITIGDAGWQASVPLARFAVEGLESPIGISGGVRLDLTDIEVAESGRLANVDLELDPAASSVALGGLRWSLPKLSAALALNGDDLSVEASIQSMDHAVNGLASARHSLETRTGEIVVRDASLDFSVRPLSGFVSPPPENWDISEGTLTSDLALRWAFDDEVFQLEGDGDLRLTAGAGNYDDIVAAGVTTALDFTVLPDNKLDFSPARATVDLVDIGLPVTNIQADYRLSSTPAAVIVEALSMRLVGGSAAAGSFRYSPASRENAIMIRLEDIQLPLIMAVADFESMSVEGSVSGVLPATIIDNRITIAGGRIEADAPGGVIRYLAGDAGADDSQLGMVTRALSNFQFESLVADVTYDDAGDLLLAMRIEGNNPDVDPDQPVIVNLNLENNVPSMLRSLQATRSIQEILEERANRRQQ